MDRAAAALQEYAPDQLDELLPEVQAELRRQWGIAAYRTAWRAPTGSPSLHERKCELAARLLGRDRGDWIDARLERGALLAVAQPWRRGWLGYRLPGLRPAFVKLPVKIKTVADALAWIMPAADVSANTPSGRAFRAWLRLRERLARSREAAL